MMTASDTPTPRADACFRTVQEGLRYVAQVAKTTVMRNSLNAGADRIEQLERAIAAAQAELEKVRGELAALKDGATNLLHAVEMEAHNEAIFSGPWKKGSKAWDGDFIRRLQKEGIAKIRAATGAVPDDRC